MPFICTLLALISLSGLARGQSMPSTSDVVEHPSRESRVPIADEYDYVYSYWPTNFRPWPHYSTVRYVNAGIYGLCFDVSTSEIVRMGPFSPPFLEASEGLLLDNAALEALPNSAVSYDTQLAGVTHPATSFQGPGGLTDNPSRLIDGGSFMQRVDVPEIGYASAAGLSGSVQLAAMPRHFALTHRTRSTAVETNATARIHLTGAAVDGLSQVAYLDGDRAVRMTDGAGDGWVFIVPEIPGTDATISLLPTGGLTASRSTARLQVDEILAVTLLALPSRGLSDAQLEVYLHPGSSVRVRFAQADRQGVVAEPITEAAFDPERGVYLVDLDPSTEVGAPVWPDWSNPLYQTWYNRHRVVLDADAGQAVSIPLALDLEAPTISSITGGCAMFRDHRGEPLGIPVQISKNWHETTAVNRHWYHFYAMPLLPAGGRHELEFTIARAKWGATFAASHAQLSLVGWGTHQQWEESALGCWGESITYDPDLTLGRSMIDDVRPFLVQSNQQYNWTGNVGGANFLTYWPVGAGANRLGRLRTLCRTPGPNLTDVTYAGVTLDGKIEAVLRTRLGRTDDVVRALYDIDYTFHEDVNYSRLALFQMAADNYSDNGFSRHAYGNASAVLFDDMSSPTGSVGYASDADRGIALTGEAPWVLLYANQYTGGSLPEEFADVGFVVRSYELVLAGGPVVTTPHVNLVHTNNWGVHPQIGFELGVPFDPAHPVVPAGSTLTATVEYLVLPSDKTRYYGPSSDLQSLSAAAFGTPELMRLLSDGNRTDLSISVGTLQRTHPIVITIAPQGEVAAQFEVTGGFGYAPIVFDGLERHDGWRLENLIGGTWNELDQEVEGNDYWQTSFEAESGHYRMTFNVDNTATTTYRLLRPGASRLSLRER